MLLTIDSGRLVTSGAKFARMLITSAPFSAARVMNSDGMTSSAAVEAGSVYVKSGRDIV